MNGPREPKKSETVEVRLPYEVKSALMDKARAEGSSASEVIRKSIDAYLADRPKEKPNMLITAWKPLALAGTAGAAILWSALAPVPSQANPNLKAVFQTLDRDRDGAITMAEFVRDASDPAVEKMHHAHMKNAADAKRMGTAHAQMMQAAHGKPSDQSLRTHFAQLDANSDGSVTFAEFQAFHDRMKASHTAH